MFDDPGLRYSHQAMRTTFEFFFPGSDSRQFQGVAEDCAAEVTDIELAISPYQEGSDVQRLNSAAGTDEWIRIGWPTHRLLQLCQNMKLVTHGAFNPFDGQRTMRVAGKILDPHTATILDDMCGVEVSQQNPIDLHPEAPLARLSEGILIDMGAIGKGWALDRCAALAQDAGVERAFFHAGGSSMVAIGSSWPVTLPGLNEDVTLTNTALSVSRRINKDAGGIHIVSLGVVSDDEDIIARVIGTSCAITDAISTAAVSTPTPESLLLHGYDLRIDRIETRLDTGNS